MAENYPENMTELNKQYLEEQKRDPTITKQQLIRRARRRCLSRLLV